MLLRCSEHNAGFVYAILDDILEGENSMQIPNRWIWGGRGSRIFLAPWPERGDEAEMKEVALDALLLFYANNVAAVLVHYTILCVTVLPRGLCHCRCGATKQTGVGREDLMSLVVVMGVWRKNRQLQE